MILKYEDFLDLVLVSKIIGWVPVAHTCDPNCPGSRDQEDQDLKPARANSLRPHLKKKSQKRAGEVA
jgi:hypothetical protein